MYISDDDLKLWERDLDSIAEEFGDGIDEPPDHHTIKQREVIQRIRDKSIIDKVRNTTKYYIVAEEELDQIKNDCAFPERLSCEDGCEYWDETGDLPCKFKGANALMDEVMERTLQEEKEKVMDMILKDLGERSMIGKAIELVEKERGEGWLREQMIKLLEVK